MTPRPEPAPLARRNGSPRESKEVETGGGRRAGGRAPGEEVVDLASSGAGKVDLRASGLEVSATATTKRRRSTTSSPHSSSDSTSPSARRRPRMDANNSLANLTHQQLLELASLARNHLLQQESWQPDAQFFPGAGNNSRQPLHQGPAYVRHGAEPISAEWGVADGSNEPTRVQSPPHHMASEAVELEEITSPTKNNTSRRGGSTARRKGKQVVNDNEPQRIKGDNFQAGEDRLLVTSWLQISCDPMINTGQTHEAFWDKITQLYNSNRQSFNERSKRSLQSRYDTIKRPVAKFSAYYADVIRRNPSGMTDADKTSLACAEFAKCEPKPFKFMHCWDIMKDNPKFQDTKHGRNYRAGQADHLQEQLFSPQANEARPDESCPTPSSTTSKRPMGRDAAKRATKRLNSSGSEFAQSMQELVMKYDGNEVTRNSRNEAYLIWKRLEQEDARQDRKVMIELEREKVQIEKQKLSIKEKLSEAEHKRVQIMYTQEEERILGIDLSKYQEPLRSFYRRKQQEILGATDALPNQE